MVGSVVLDIIAQPHADGDDFEPGTSNIGCIRQVLGGVGKNIAESFSRVQAGVGSPALLVSAVSRAESGEAMLAAMGQQHLGQQGVLRLEGNSVSSKIVFLYRGVERDHTHPPTW